MTTISKAIALLLDRAATVDSLPIARHDAAVPPDRYSIRSNGELKTVSHRLVATKMLPNAPSGYSAAACAAASDVKLPACVSISGNKLAN